MTVSLPFGIHSRAERVRLAIVTDQEIPGNALADLEWILAKIGTLLDENERLAGLEVAVKAALDELSVPVSSEYCAPIEAAVKLLRAALGEPEAGECDPVECAEEECVRFGCIREAVEPQM